MLILDTVNRDCGWLPDQTIQLIANIYTIIKFLVPLLIIIMGSIDFLKAVMAQQEDQIKKAQSSFLQKLIAGALVFFVAVIVGWVVKLISDLDTKGETTAGNTATCLNLILNGGYRQHDKNYFKTTATTDTSTTVISTTDTSTTTKSNKETCFTKCFNEGKDEAYCNKHCGDISEGNWDSCMSSCLEVQNEAYCKKHCDVEFNGGINHNQNITTTTSKQTANNTNEWDKCMNSCQDAGQNQNYCKKNCDTELNGGAN